MNGLLVKNVEFNGAMLRAAQVENIVWVGVKWICDGLGLSEDRGKYERKKIQKDLVLKNGLKFLPIGRSNGNKNALCIKIDYLPLWLAKISITPKMIRNNNNIANNLYKYQKNVKDVLFDGFLNGKINIDSTISGDNHFVQNNTGYIYVMELFNYYKIGKVENANADRFGEYTRLPEKPIYIMKEFCRDYNMVEKKLHKIFSEKRTRGEWFLLNEADLQRIKEILSKYTIVKELMAE